MTGQKQTRKNTSSSCNKPSLERRWGHPLVAFLAGVGFWISHVVLAIGVIAVTLLTLFDVQMDGAWAVVAPAFTMVSDMPCYSPLPAGSFAAAANLKKGRQWRIGIKGQLQKP